MSRYPCTSAALTCTPSTLGCIIRIHQGSSSAVHGEKSQPCSNSHAAGAASANRDIGSWMQAWSQWLFCSWHGLYLIGIGHAEWSSEEGYGNAPTESIKWGDTLRPYDGQRINESQRKGNRGVRTEVVEWAYLSGKYSVLKSVPQWTKTENGKKHTHTHTRTDVPTLLPKL